MVISEFLNTLQAEPDIQHFLDRLDRLDRIVTEQLPLLNSNVRGVEKQLDRIGRIADLLPAMMERENALATSAEKREKEISLLSDRVECMAVIESRLSTLTAGVTWLVVAIGGMAITVLYHVFGVR